MNKSENVSHRKSVLDNENHKRGRKPPNVAKRSGPSKIILNSDKASSQEDKSDKKKTRNSKLDIFEDLKVQLIRKKSSKKSLSNVSNVKLIEVPDGNGIKFESPEVLQNGSFTLRESFIEAITSDKLKKKINSQSIFSRQQPTNDRSPEVKLTRSDYRKIQINEILKGHAQKISSSSSKSYMQIKEAPLQGVAELLIKARDFRNADEMDKIKNSEAANDVERKEKDENKGKIVRKMAANKWMGYPPSKELESRLRGTWTGSLLFQDAEEESGDIDGAEDEGGKKLLDEDEKKRTTYTDRLLFLKSVRKNEAKESEDFNEDEGEENGQIEAGSKINLKIAIHDYVNQSKASNAGSNANATPDGILKPKASKSAELRDLVNQAVKEHKIFCIFDNHWYIVRPVREELLNRGWLEVIPDKRLIPRRRPPPTGPVLDRDKVILDRNCNTIEAILAAKEAFVNELEETVAKSQTFKSPTERSKISLSGTLPSKKQSEDSLKECDSLFRIIPPTSEKKRNNFEIRDFVTRCQTIAKRESENEKNLKLAKRKSAGKANKKSKESGVQLKSQKSKIGLSQPLPLTHGLQAILDTINDNKKTILQAMAEFQQKDGILEKAETVKESSVEESDAEEESSKVEKREREETQKITFRENDVKAISKIIQSTNAKIHFMWLSIKPAIHLKCFNYSPEIINKFQKTTFCTKIGLWNHLNSIQWYAHEVHSPAKSPRMYNTGEADDLQAFFQDFQLTACIGMLKWLSDTFFDRGIKAVQAKKGKVPLRAFEFAIKQCERYMRFKDNEDLSLVEEPKVLQEEWNTFLQWFYTITNDHGKLQECSNAQLMVVYTKAVETLRIMKKYWPEIEIDGRLNIWIMKPYCASCGRGIFMTNNVYYIGQHSKYIVQKYIEKPFLIYNTKFDIRQWFMITKLTPLEIWMYKECYLRFCTQPFALRNLHESVHLSNNSVQRKYVNRVDNTMPDQNMWDSNTFQMYLNTIGHPNAWKEIIYPGMKDAIVSIMLAAQDNFDGPRRSWFEVYGADFMLSSNVKDGPWLIEINENPAMDPSTKVTARLCPQMLRDVIKVVVDKKANKNASTGQWELVYRQNYSPSFATVDLDVKGKKIARVPTPLKIEFGNNPNSSTTDRKRGDNPDQNYEIIKCLNDAKNDDGKKLEAFRKDSEKYKYNKSTQSAQMLLKKVSENEGSSKIGNRSLTFGKPKFKETRESSAKLPTGKDDKQHVENFDFRYEKLKSKNSRSEDEVNKFKFSKFYKL